jgi:hypothetical protein
MFNIKGEILIRFTNEKGEQTKEDYTQKNLIYNQTLIGLLGFSPTPSFSSLLNCRISISGQTVAPDPNDNVLTDIIATGNNPTGETTPIWFEDIEPNFGQIINQFPTPGISRTFDSVGLTNRSPNNDEGGVSGTALTTVLLSISCTQEATEILTIFYFVKVVDDYKNYFNKRFLKDFGGSLFNVKTCFLDYVAASYASPPSITAYDNLYFYDNDRVLTQSQWDTGAAVNNHYKWKQTKLFTIENSGIPGQTDQEIGRIFNSMLVGRSNNIEPEEINPSNPNYIKGNTESEATNTAYRMQRYRPSQISLSVGLTARIPPFQPLWGHRPGASKPFFEPIFKERGNGIIRTAGTWSADMPTMYRIEITADGATGVSTYKFSKRYHVGFDGNTWVNRINGIPFRNPNIASFDALHGWKPEDNDLLRFSNSKIAQYDANGVTLIDILSSEYKVFDSLTTPALNASTIRQCAVDSTNQLIYVACRATGLHVINIGANTVATISSTPCYGVDVGFNNIAYALFDGALKSSTNWAVNLAITFIGLTDSNWSKCYYIKANPSNTNKQIAIIIENPSNSSERQIVWYSDVTNTAVAGAANGGIERYAASFDVSNTDDFWADSVGGKYIFNDSNRYTTDNCVSRSINHPIWGNINLFGKVSFYNEYLIAGARLIDKADNTITYNKNPNASYTTCHLVGATTCFGSELLNLLPYDDAWISYGWNGSAWVINNSSSKTTHTSIDNLIDGLTIQFADGATIPQFVNGDYYTQSLNLGTLKDNSIALYYENFWYTKRVNFDTTVNIPITATTETFPEASNVGWIRVENDSIDALSQFLINGVQVLKVWVNGTAPNINEITIDAVLGEITFNAADIGKTLTGTYAWIEDS